MVRLSALVFLVMIVLIVMVQTGARIFGSDDMVAYITSQNWRTTINISDGRFALEVSDDFTRFMPVWSADGQLAWNTFRNDEFGVSVWTDGETRRITTPRLGRFLNPVAWSTDGRLVLVADYLDSERVNQRIYVWDGETITYIGQQPVRDDIPVWSRDGRLAWNSYFQGQGSIVVWDGSQRFQAGTTYSSTQPVWSADGRLAWKSNNEREWEILVWDGETAAVIASGTGAVENPKWSRDGWLAWTVVTGLNTRLMVWNGSAVQEVDNVDQIISEFVWSDDHWLAWTERYEPIRVWDGERVITLESGAGAGLTWSRDGRLAWDVSTGADREIYVWDRSRVILIRRDIPGLVPRWLENGWLMWGSYTGHVVWKPESGEVATMNVVLGQSVDYPVWYIGE